MNHRNLIILSLSQSLGFAGAPLIIFAGGVTGTRLAPSPAWATIPIAAMVVGVALFTVPAALVMKKTGRRLGFIAGSLFAAIGSLAAAHAISMQSFSLFCGATSLIGANLAFIQQYRFAAAESVDTKHVSKAISLVLLGGIAAGFLGPEIAKRTKNILDYGDYALSFIRLEILYIIVAGALFFLRETRQQEESAIGRARPLRQIIAQPGYFVAVLGGMVAYGVMSFIKNYQPTERFKAQDSNDLMIFGTQAIMSLSAGAVMHRTHWDILNLLTLPLLVAVLLMMLMLRRYLTSAAQPLALSLAK